MLFAVAVAVGVAACGGGQTVGSTAPSARPSASLRIGAVTPRPSPTAKPTPDPNALGVKVTAHTKSARRGGTASLTAKTSPGAECGISVNYPTGPSTAPGLEPAKAPKSGSVTWTWKVASSTPKGTWPIVVSCTIGDHYGETKTTFAVK
jgi:hypothetical protein